MAIHPSVLICSSAPQPTSQGGHGAVGERPVPGRRADPGIMYLATARYVIRRAFDDDDDDERAVFAMHRPVVNPQAEFPP